MAEIRHLENRQIAISQRQIIQFWWHLVHNGTLGTRWQCVTEYDFYNSRCRTVAILKIVIFGHTSAADCPISVKFCAGKQFFISISNGTDIRVRQNVFFVFLMQLGLRRAAAFVSHPIHLLLIYYTLFFATNTMIHICNNIHSHHHALLNSETKRYCLHRTHRG